MSPRAKELLERSTLVLTCDGYLEPVGSATVVNLVEVDRRRKGVSLVWPEGLALEEEMLFRREVLREREALRMLIAWKMASRDFRLASEVPEVYAIEPAIV